MSKHSESEVFHYGNVAPPEQWASAAPTLRMAISGVELAMHVLAVLFAGMFFLALLISDVNDEVGALGIVASPFSCVSVCLWRNARVRVREGTVFRWNAEGIEWSSTVRGNGYARWEDIHSVEAHDEKMRLHSGELISLGLFNCERLKDTGIAANLATSRLVPENISKAFSRSFQNGEPALWHKLLVVAVGLVMAVYYYFEQLNSIPPYISVALFVLSLILGGVITLLGKVHKSSSEVPVDRKVSPYA